MLGGAAGLVGIGVAVTGVRQSVAFRETLGEVERADALAGDGRVGQLLVYHDDVEARARRLLGLDGGEGGGGRHGGSLKYVAGTGAGSVCDGSSSFPSLTLPAPGSRRPPHRPRRRRVV